MKQDTRTALMDTAENALRRFGYDGFSYADLAQAVGIRKASIHYHFPKKAKLAAELVTRYQDKVLSYCDKIDAASPTGAAKLLGLVEFYREATAGGQQLCLCVALSSVPESLTVDVTQATNRFRAALIGWLEKVFAEAVDDNSVESAGKAEEEARALLALLEGAQLSARVNRSVTAFDHATAQFRNRVTCGNQSSEVGRTK